MEETQSSKIVQRPCSNLPVTQTQAYLHLPGIELALHILGLLSRTDKLAERKWITGDLSREFYLVLGSLILAILVFQGTADRKQHHIERGAARRRRIPRPGQRN